MTHAPERVEVSISGCRVVCSCGWASSATLEHSTTSKIQALTWWYEHSIQRARGDNERP